jgi:hypothetical protein
MLKITNNLILKEACGSTLGKAGLDHMKVKESSGNPVHSGEDWICNWTY